MVHMKDDWVMHLRYIGVEIIQHAAHHSCAPLNTQSSLALQGD